jgi:hypothetical protein
LPCRLHQYSDNPLIRQRVFFFLPSRLWLSPQVSTPNETGMAIKLPSHLHRAPSGVLHFRIAIPPDLYPHFTTREIYRSLRTASVHDAVPTAQALARAAKRVFLQLRTQPMSSSKKTPIDPPYGSEWGLITEVSIDEFMRPKLKLIPEPGDTPEDRVQAQVDFLRAVGIAGAGGQIGASTGVGPGLPYGRKNIRERGGCDNTGPIQLH